MTHSIRTLLETSRFRVIEHNVSQSDGTSATCSTVVHPGAVVVLPWVDDDRICLIRSHRLSVNKTLIELPAGTREPDETPLETARRELAEETGYRAGHLEHLASFYTSPGITDEQMHAFAASGIIPGAPAREANEQIENLVVRWEEALAMADRGEIEDAKTLLTLWAYARKVTGSH